MNQTSSDWKNTAVDNGQNLSKAVEEGFYKSVDDTMKVIEEKSEENIKELLTVQLDYLFGTAVAVSAQFINDGPEFEESIVNLVKSKFAIIRSMNEEKQNESKRTVE